MEEYYISFNTKINPGKIEATKVTLGLETVTDMNKQMKINLCDHPLYKELQEYVKLNPR